MNDLICELVKEDDPFLRETPETFNFDNPQVDSEKLVDFYKTCKNMDLNIIGTMCLPPENQDSNIFFSEMKNLNNSLSLSELSMGMSHDYINAIEHSATFIRIGSKIFGNRN